MRLLLFLLITVNAHASIDTSARDIIIWDNKELAADISDAGMQTAFFAPTLLFFSGENRAKRLGGYLVAHGTVAFLSRATKAWAKRVRPNGSNDESFFSGHTSSSFTSAGYLCAYEPKYCAVGLALASATGYMRIAADRHWLSDVMVGMIVGYGGGYILPTIIIER